MERKRSHLVVSRELRLEVSHYQQYQTNRVVYILMEKRPLLMTHHQIKAYIPNRLILI
ncbi:hypothetical protein GFS03_12540 [Sulfolobus sp. E5-1-F]|uniref:hypothetical protein n=1 Tax=Saccharolobus sp. E5-1-F TaxID=2663019 RepID=UPI001294FC94|nr:hypothetical protein [Sulfolobus sp. E5-1-F]QGA55339.1 hypothetical protein GFS03_12540 [Sulfolobus sp. E5-1-F]